ncbi:hypothetical protein DL764_007657 [Monosporascus ibericus]|uniref:Uncharacterized protein n=1 Tax=Monosporascus ibericus TaxID=155417 RepID=A0A4Q4SZG9_9PEZI|nr:hypothetical protein DL764_007657 [Monosporascus ibericus]
MDYPTTLPYPRLDEQRGILKQEQALLEPLAQASKRVPDSLTTHPDSFGSLKRVYTRDVYGKEFHFAYVRRNKGQIDHGMARAFRKRYENAKYNVLLHPNRDENNNPCYVDHDQRTWRDMDASMKKMLALSSWPLLKGVPTVAPFVKSETGFSRVVAKQPMAFTAVFTMPEVLKEILKHVSTEWESMSNLGRTCQTVFCAIGDSMTQCDMNKGDFLNLDKSESQLAGLVKKGELTQDQADRVGVSWLLSVSPFRMEGTDHAEIPMNEYGFYDYQIMLKLPTMRKIVDSHIKLYRAFLYHGEHMQKILLHRVTLLNIPAVKTIVRTMSNLSHLGIYNCELLTLQAVIPLLEIITEANQRRQERNAAHVNLDFSPRFFQGPMVNGKCYGVIPYDNGTINTQKATVPIIMKAINMALDTDINLVRPGTAFRRYLEKIPFKLDTLYHILEAIHNIRDYKNGLHGGLATLSEDQKLEMETALWYDLIIATNGKCMDESKLRKILMLNNSIALMDCRDCGQSLPSNFYRGEVVARRAEYRICHGCELADFLSHHQYNMRQPKGELAMKMWDFGKIQDFTTLLRRPSTQASGILAGSLATRNGRDQRDAPETWLDRMKGLGEELDKASAQRQHIIAKAEDKVEKLRLLQVKSGTRDYIKSQLRENSIQDLVERIQVNMLLLGRAQTQRRPENSVATNWQDQIMNYRESLREQWSKWLNNDPYALPGDDGARPDDLSPDP